MLAPEIIGILLGFFVQSLLVAYSYGRLRESVNGLHFRLDNHEQRIARMEDLHTHGTPQTLES